MTPIAEQLIHDLRNDPHTQRHFSMGRWDGKGTCNTIGCLSGTAIFMAYPKWKLNLSGVERLNNLKFEVNKTELQLGAEILGLEYLTARDLFISRDWAAGLILKGSGQFNYLPKQARPDLSTVAAMTEFAETFNYKISSQQAALALERIVKDEVLYCDWRYAIENA